MPDEFGNPLPGEPDFTTWAINQQLAPGRYHPVELEYLANIALRRWYNNAIDFGDLQTTYTNPQPQKTARKIPEENVKVSNSFLIGCDPEMILVKDGQIVNVSGKMKAHGEVGYDHGGNVVELRPAPAKSAFTLTKRLHTLLKESPELTQFESEKWRAGAYFESKETGGGLNGVGAAPNPAPAPEFPTTTFNVRPGDVLQYVPEPPANRWAWARGTTTTQPNPPRSRVSLGGHIHLDIKRPEHTWGRDPIDWYYEQDYVPALDRVTRYFEHLDLLPQKECLKRRESGGYGQFADIRAEHGRMEYRTMASWLFSPKTTMLALTGAKLAAVDPALALDTLKLKDISFKNLERFYEAFPEDSDAKRVCEEILAKGLKDLQANPDQDVKGAWG